MKNSVVALALLAGACSAPHGAPAAPPPAAAQGPQVILPDGAAIQVELATDDATRAEGLMYRDRLAEDHGMLFMFPESGDYPFWMKNTLIPLDMIWIDDGRRIVHISSNVPPCKADPCPNYPPNAKARYVLELAAGVAAKHHLGNGQTLRFEGTANAVVR
ncbi:MAG TPA: DUF192 domain-containing protein [Thermoanaerobaculia bacterium]|nr:DUF192 domain-containing protein [Thermoanaerobaculia bacterium]